MLLYVCVSHRCALAGPKKMEHITAMSVKSLMPLLATHLAVYGSVLRTRFRLEVSSPFAVTESDDLCAAVLNEAMHLFQLYTYLGLYGGLQSAELASSSRLLARDELLFRRHLGRVEAVLYVVALSLCVCVCLYVWLLLTLC